MPQIDLTNLISWWSLDEASGSRADKHGANTLTDNNTVLSAAGKKSNAGNFVRRSRRDSNPRSRP
jgi:hypothetical protein